MADVVRGLWCVASGVWHVVCGMWHVACGTWCVACGVWHVVCGMWCVQAVHMWCLYMLHVMCMCMACVHDVYVTCVCCVCVVCCCYLCHVAVRDVEPLWVCGPPATTRPQTVTRHAPGGELTSLQTAAGSLRGQRTFCSTTTQILAQVIKNNQ